jgi:hypothetical protein
MLIDSQTGDRHSPSRFYGASDEDYRSKYLAHVRGEIDTPTWWDYIRTRAKQWELTPFTHRRRIYFCSRG